jgi:uracil-DNA glycosylase family 4
VRLGQPFVGQSGDNFDAALFKTTWRRSDFYITNICKCFTDNNRSPSTGHIEKCQVWLKIEIATIKPKLVIAFGSVAFNALCDAKFSESIGKITASEKFGVKVFTTYHPSPLNLADNRRHKKFEHDVHTIGRIMAYYLTPF